jgi:hypothetical protein
MHQIAMLCIGLCMLLLTNSFMLVLIIFLNVGINVCSQISLSYVYSEEIRLYFGEAVALYFNFLGFYNVALLLPMVLGVLQLFLSTESIAFFCVLNVFWVTIFLEVSTFSRSFGTFLGPHNTCKLSFIIIANIALSVKGMHISMWITSPKQIVGHTHDLRCIFLSSNVVLKSVPKLIFLTIFQLFRLDVFINVFYSVVLVY